MSLGKPSVKNLLFTALLVVGISMLLYMLVDSESLLRRVLAGRGVGQFTETRLVTFIKSYGYWLFVAYVVVTAGALFMENRNPDRTLAWLLVLILLPVVGLALYWILGPNMRYLADKRRFRLPKPRPSPLLPLDQVDNPLVADTASVIYRAGGSHLFGDTACQVMVDVDEVYTQMLQAIARAQTCILLETYIWANDEIGNSFKNMLIRKARSGVEVVVIYDSVGSWGIGAHVVRAMREAGIRVHAFLPVSFPMFRGAHYRNHRKILVVDGLVGFIGGVNITDDCVGRNPKIGPWRDTHVRVEGKIVDQIRTIFLDDLGACGVSNEEIDCLRALEGEPGCSSGQVVSQIAASGPDTAWDTIARGYFSLITRAREKVWITTPYLVPEDSLITAMCNAALSGVDVRVLIPEKCDHSLITWASRNTCEELLRAGVRIFLYQYFVHSKTITCDARVLAVGSANFDSRSLSINFEIQGFFYDVTLARQAERQFALDCGKARELTFTEWQRRPFIHKIQESIGKLISPLA